MRRSILRWAMTTAALLAPAWVMAGDQETAQQIADELRGSGRLVDYSIGVKYENGTAWLLGRVASGAQADEAIAMTQKMPMVNKVVNNLEIKATRPATTATKTTEAAKSGTTVKNLFEKKPSTVPADPLAEHQDTSRLAPPSEPARGEQAAASRMTQWTQSFKGMLGLGNTQPSSKSQSKSPDFEGQLTAFEDAEPGPVRQTSARAPATQPTTNRTAQQSASIPNAMPRQTAAAPAHAAPRPISRVAMNHSQGGPIGPIQGAAGGPTPAMAAGYNTPAYDQPHLPNHAWPSYASYPNYAAVTYPKQYSPSAWPYIGPFYPYPQVPLGWRKVTLEWDDGWWYLDFSNRRDRRRH